MKTATKLFFFILICSYSFSLYAQIKGYIKPVDTEFPLSTTFKVEIQQGASAFEEITVFKYTVPENDKVTKTENFAMFAFEPTTGAVTAKISMINGTALTSSMIEVVNKSLTDMTWRFEEGKLLVTSASAKRQILVRFKADYSNQLLLCIDPYQEREIPANANVKRFTAAGSPHIQTAQYDRYSVPNDIDVVYIEEGAVVRGTIHTQNGRSKPLTLMGRGFLIGNGNVVSGSSGIPYNALELNDGSGHIIDGICSFSPRHFNIRIAKNSLITNVKMFGYNANIDGIVAGEGSTIEYCYSKVNDDHIKLYNNNITVRNCNFYEQTNGGVFQLAWNSIKPGSNCLVENCEILAWEAGCGDPKLGQGGIARSFVNLRETDAGSTSTNTIFRNIYIQGQMPRFICINGKYGSSKPVSLTNFTFENIVVDKKPSTYSWIYTGDPHKISFSFKNVTMAGQCLTADNYVFNTEGNVELSYHTCGPPDEEAPTVPTNLKLDSASYSSLSLSWSESTDNVAVTGYEIYLDDVLKAISTSTNTTIGELESGKSFSIKIRAKDAAGNFSDFTSAISESTTVCSDTDAPSKPQNLSLVSKTDNSLSISWDASTDVVGVLGYEVFINDQYVKTVETNEALLSVLSCETSYAIHVKAFDACSNFSLSSDGLEVSTDDCPPCTVNFQGGNGAEAGQTAYVVNTIPGKIKAVDFDNGGQNVAYYESDGRAVWAHPTLRTDEDIDVDEADGSTEASGAVIGGIAEGEWAEYTVNITKSGDYSIKVKHGCNGDKTAYFKLDNSIIGCINTFPSTGKASTYAETTLPTTFNLPAGEHVFAWVSESSFAFNFDFFEFILENGGTAIKHVEDETNNYLITTVINRYESLLIDLSLWDKSVDLTIYNLQGKHIKSATICGQNKNASCALPLEMSSGIYLVKLNDSQKQYVAKFVLK